MLKITRDTQTGISSVNAYDENGLLLDNVPVSPNHRAFATLLEFDRPEKATAATLFENSNELIKYCQTNGITLVSDTGLIDNLLHEMIRHVFMENSYRFSDSREGCIVRLARADRLADEPRFERDGIGATATNLWISRDLNRTLVGDFRDDASDIRRVSNCPINRTFVYVDVSDFSQFPPGQQLLVINSLANIVRNRNYWEYDPSAREALDDLEAMLCIGDGYIYVFKDTLHGTYFASHLAGLVESLVALRKVPIEFHFRMGVDWGPVQCFFDPGRKDWNYIGNGINDGQRILSSIDKSTDDVLYISSTVRSFLMACPSWRYIADVIVSNTTNKGRRADKHGKMRRVYEVNYSGMFMREKYTFNLILNQETR